MRRSNRRRGANAVEFALLLPVFVALVTGSIEFGWMLFQAGAARTAVTRGCRTAALLDPGLREANLASIQLAADTAVKQTLVQTGGKCSGCSVTTAAVGTRPNRSIRCTLNVPYVSLTSMAMGPAMTEAVTVRLEYQRSLD